MIILRIICVNVIDHNGYETNMLRRTLLFLGQATTFEYMYIYVAISAGGILVVMATIVAVGCTYKQGMVLLKTYISTLMGTTCVCNNLHLVLTHPKTGKRRYLT